jgi:4-amino-4-deoxy-L-arabinose transferase-like glycosyltransferase
VNGWAQNARLALPALLWVAVLFVLYSDKAYTIDDPFFLAQAQQVLREPLNPAGFDIAWGKEFGRASEVSPTGPGMAYILAPTAALGGAEWAAHLTVFGFLAAGAWLAVAIARRFGATPNEARLASLVLVSTPTVMAMAGTAMPDVPAMTVGLVGLERTLAFRADRRTSQGISVAVAFAAAILIRSHTVMLLPVAATLLVGAELRSGLRAVEGRRLWPLGAAVLIAAVFAWITRDAQSGTMNFTTSIDFVKLRAIPRHFVGFCFHFVFAIPLALAWSAMHFRRLSLRMFLAALIAAVLIVQLSSVWVAPLAAFGAAVLVDAARDAWRSRDPERMALILWLCAALPVSIYVHLPVKYLTISAPAVALLLVLDARAQSARLRRGVLAAWMVGGSVLGLLILQADARLAAVGREAAARLIAPQVAAGKTVWYAGSWGFHWYAEAAGARPLGADPDGPRPGDYIVYSAYRAAAVGDEHYGRRVDSVVDSGPGGRVMDRSAGAGFYTEGYGYLPWSWGTGEVDHYELWRIAKPPRSGRRREIIPRSATQAR